MVRKALKWLSVGLAVVIISLLVLNIIWGRQIKAELAKISAKGEPTSVADMVKPAIPDSENGALIYIEIGKRLSTDDAGKDLDTLGDLTSRQRREKNPQLWHESKAIIGKYKGVVALAESAAAKPRCRFPASWWMSGSDAVPWRYYSMLRSLAMLLHANVLLSAKDGRMEECCRSISLDIKLANGLNDERTMLAYINGIAILNIAHASLQDSLNYGNFDQHQVRQLYDALSDIDLLQGRRQALFGERVFLLHVPSTGRGVDVVRASRVRDWSSLADDMAGSNRKPMDHVLGLAYDMAGRNGDVLVWLRFMNKQVSGLPLSYKQAAAEGMLEYEPHLPFYALLSNMAAGSEDQASLSRFGAMSRIAGDQTLLALIAYKDRFGAYPVNLAGLRSRLGWKIPVDPFSGKDFIYRCEGKGFLLYSIGPDLRDDGGKEPPKNDKDKDDIIWRMEH